MINVMKKIKWSSGANKDLDRLRFYCEAFFGNRLAKKIIASTMNKNRSARNFPQYRAVGTFAEPPSRTLAFACHTSERKGYLSDQARVSEYCCIMGHQTRTEIPCQLYRSHSPNRTCYFKRTFNSIYKNRQVKNLCNSVTIIVIVHSVTGGACRKTSLNLLSRTDFAPTAFLPTRHCRSKHFGTCRKTICPNT